MKSRCVGTAILVVCWLAGIGESHAGGSTLVPSGGGGMSGAFGGAGVSGGTFAGGGGALTGGLGGGMIGMSGFSGGCCRMPASFLGGQGGMIGSFTGCCGGVPGCTFNGCIGGIGCSFGGCCGGFPCSFGGCFGGVPCSFGGCCGGMPQFTNPPMGFGTVPVQTYSRWIPSPGRLYFYRTLTIQTAGQNQAALEFVLVHYPDRAKHFYFYDPVEKKYFGRYRLGAAATNCFDILGFADRKANLNDIAETAYRNTSGMPAMPQVIRARSGTTVDPNLQTLKLLRPPESIPDELLGLPAEESFPKK